MKNPIKSALHSLFTPKETSFIVWFMVIFIGSAGVLSLFGLLPSELTEQYDGQTLSERITGTVAGVVSSDPATTGNSNASGESNGLGGSNTSDGSPYSQSALGILNSTSQANSSSNTSSNTTGGTQGVSDSPKNILQNGLPSRLVIPSIRVDTQVVIPRNTSISTLDTDLTKGPVYYPGSGTINGGNMFIFGHSTGYKVVLNKAYKVFNDLNTLSQGDSIYIESEGKKFLYRVRSVNKVDKNETLVTFDTNEDLLTLSTCNSFGAKSDRYVVVAEFVGQV
jgi:LPXTG-site transpeptidase (sortase) family protein